MPALKDLTKDQIISALKDASSLTDACGKLNATKNGGNRKWLRKFISENNIDISHFIKTQTKKEYLQNPKHCKFCGKEIDWDHRDNDFCSHSCSVSFNNKNRELKSKESHFCRNCGKPLNNHQVFYCCQSCQKEFEQKEYISRWKQGLENGLKGEYGISLRIRRHLLDKTNCKCELCGWGEKNPFTNTIPLEIHHKDGDYTNNKEENLQVLCPNCHSLTQTYKSHNKDGRKGRDRYY